MGPEVDLMAAQHCWTEDDDVVAFYLSRFQGIRFLGIGLATIAKILSERPQPNGKPAVPMSSVSLSYRIGNFDYLDGKPGWSNYAPNKSGLVYEKYKNASIVELRSVVIQILGITVSDNVERTFQEFCKKFLKPKLPTK
jgi:hypothetical protein